MNTLLIFLIFIIFLIVIAILIDLSGIFKSPEPLTTNKGVSIEKQQASLPANVSLPNPTWSQPQAYGPTGTNTCNIYTFLSGEFTPAVASYSKLNSGSRDYLIQSIDPNYVCLDSDQIFAQTISHQCINANGSSAGAGCILTVPTGGYQAGDFVPQGFVEGEDTPLYTPCVPSNINNNKSNSSYCLGNIGLIVPNFQPQEFFYEEGENKCLAGLWYEGLTGQSLYNTGLEDCSLAQSTQIFRMIRYNIDSQGNLKQNDKGPLAAIVHRYTGYYLAPRLPQLPYTISGNTGFYYDFNNPYFNYNVITDNFGNKFPVSMDLVLINPQYDTSRNGVYWLLQNQTLNPSVNPNGTTFSSFVNRGIYYNQLDYVTQYKPKNTNDSNTLPTVPSYYFEQTVNYCTGNTGVTGCSSNAPLTISNNSGVSGCYFGTDSSNNIIKNVPVDLAAQQIVYVPDLNLLPDPNSSAIWTYLVNSFSINIVNNSPILTPYRTTSTIDLNYNCINDPNDVGNFFTQLIGITDSQDYLINQTSDSQFINYNMFAQQIQTGVSSNSNILNPNYSKLSNPFNY
jgi:hypothetical protein